MLVLSTNNVDAIKIDGDIIIGFHYYFKKGIRHQKVTIIAPKDKRIERVDKSEWSNASNKEFKKIIK